MSKILFALVVSMFGAAVPGHAGGSNIVFLPVDFKGYSSRNVEAVEVERQVAAASKLPESRSAEFDPEGHWGRVVSGFQLSLRFSTNTFTAGQTIEATVLLRNVTTNTLIVLGPHPAFIEFKVVDERNNVVQPVSRLVSVSGPVRLALPSHRQLAYQLQLNQMFNLGPGKYAVCAERRVDNELGETIGQVLSARAAITILGP